MDSTNIDKVADQIQKAFEKEYGDGALGRLSDEDSLSKIGTWVSSGSDVVDFVLAGGRQQPCPLVPFGRQIEISGLPGSGKSTFCAMVAAQTQKIGGVVVIVDTEDRVDHPYWEDLGVDTSRVLSIKETKIEDIFRKQLKLIELVKKTSPDTPILMLWDSIGGSSVLKDDADPMSDESYGKEAKVMSRGLKQINHQIAKSNVCYMYTNHLYMKMGISYGDQWETSGGQKLKFFATVRLRLQHMGQITEQDEFGNKVVIGNKVLVKALKNSMSPKLIEMEGAIIGGNGFDNNWTIKELAEMSKVISKAGAWSTCKMPSGEDVKYQGWRGFVEKVVSHPEYPELRKNVWGVA
jgi:recombination protein RecA